MLIAVAGGVAGAAGFATWAVRGRSSQVFGPSVWRGSRQSSSIALTFDDGPSESTPQLLEILAEQGAKATFFQCGANVERLPQVARAVADAGHEIGNHSWSHAALYLRRAAWMEAEISRAQQVIGHATGRTPRWFRAPYGARWFGLGGVLRRAGLRGVMWTAIARDWRLEAGPIARRLLRAASGGAIFCLHDGRELTARPDIRPTMEALRRILPELRARGYQFATVSQLLCPTN